MDNPDENTHITPEDDTVIPVNPDDDTIIRVPIDETIVGSVEIIESTVIDAATVDDATIVGAVIPVEDDTIITVDETVIPDSTTGQYNTLIGSMLDTSLGVKQLLGDLDLYIEDLEDKIENLNEEITDLTNENEQLKERIGALEE